MTELHPPTYQNYQKFQYPSSMFTDQAAFNSHIIEMVFEARAAQNVMDTDIVYTNINRRWLRQAVNAMERRRLRCFKSYSTQNNTLRIKAMNSAIHNSDQTWFNLARSRWERQGVLTQNESDELSRSQGSTFYRFPDGPYVGTRKSPNVGVIVAPSVLPGVVIESGWSQGIDDLHTDMREWLVGGNGRVRAVIILKWSRVRPRHVRGFAELYMLDRSGMPRLAQSEQIFPTPPAVVARAQAIELTRRTFFGGQITPGRNPLGVFDMTIDDLRRAALPELALMNLLPA